MPYPKDTRCTLMDSQGEHEQLSSRNNRILKLVASYCTVDTV